MNSIPNNSKISIEPALTHQQPIEHYHPRIISIDRTLSSTNQNPIDIGWWGWAGSFNIHGIWR